MLKYDPIADIRHWPTSLRKYGLTPHGDPLYRIVFAPSRRYLVCGEWPDGSNCAQWVPLYRAMGDIWVMEKWRSPEEFHFKGKQHWDLNEAHRLGPWPTKGEYQFCHGFEVSTPDDANIEKLITWINAGQNIRLADTIQWHRDDHERQLKENRAKADAIIRNALPAYGSRVVFSSKVGRGTEKVFGNTELKYSAQELGLPTTPGMRTISRRTRRKAA